MSARSHAPPRFLPAALLPEALAGRREAEYNARMRVLLLMVLVAACKKDAAPPPAPAPAPAPAPKLHEDVVNELYVVVVPKGGDATPIAGQLRARLKAATVRILDQPAIKPDERELIALTNPELTPADLDGIAAGTAIGVMVKGEPIATLRALTPAVRDAAAAVRGWVLDPGSGGAYTVSQFQKHVLGDVLDVRKQIYVHSVSGDGEQPFLDTEGMRKLGFPELSVSVAAEGQLDALTILIDAAAQTLIAHPDLTVPGTLDIDLAALPGEWHAAEHRKAGGTAQAQFRMEWHPVDGGVPEIELVPGPGRGTVGAAALIDSCFGKVQEPMANAPADDPELEAAARRARKDLLGMRAHFADGVPFKESLAVKAPFTAADGRVEWMWVDVVSWKGDGFQGTLDNDPEIVKTLKEGSPVSVPFAKVADYTLVKADGTQVGGYSVEILLKRERARSARH